MDLRKPAKTRLIGITNTTEEVCGMEYLNKQQIAARGIRLNEHPSIHATGSVRGMKKLRFWGKNDRIIRHGQYYYNLSICTWREGRL